MEEELPVDIAAKRGRVDGDLAYADELRGGDLVERHAFPVRPRRVDRQQGLSVALRVLRPKPLLQLAVLALEGEPALRVEEIRHDADDA